MLARDRLSLSTMSHLLVKVFFGYGERIPVETAFLFSFLLTETDRAFLD